ncbi:hypothetical protein HRbin26_01899 [bacterium HR26]|nr:hypothetical protein HRbin26_01899 [bacterium HR26]
MRAHETAPGKCRPRGPVSRPRLAAVALALLLLLAPACSRKEEVETTVDPAHLVSAAADRLDQVKSFHFVLTHESGGTPILQTMLLTQAEGDVARPGQMKAQLDVEAVGAALQLQFIGIGDQAWLSNPFNPAEWQPLPDTAADDVLNVEALPEVLRQIKDARLIGQETVDGVATYHIQGKLDSGDLAAVVPSGAEPGLEVTVDLWIGKDDSIVRRVVVSGALTFNEATTMKRTLELSGFDQPVTITPPQ